MDLVEYESECRVRAIDDKKRRGMNRKFESERKTFETFRSELEYRGGEERRGAKRKTKSCFLPYVSAPNLVFQYIMYPIHLCFNCACSK